LFLINRLNALGAGISLFVVNFFALQINILAFDGFYVGVGSLSVFLWFASADFAFCSHGLVKIPLEKKIDIAILNTTYYYLILL